SGQRGGGVRPRRPPHPGRRLRRPGGPDPLAPRPRWRRRRRPGGERSRGRPAPRGAGLAAPPPALRLARPSRALAADGTLIARALGRLRPRYDAMVLDLPSSLSRLTVSALAAADGIVIPVTASAVGLRGLAGFRDWLASFRADRTITAPVWGVLLTQADLDEQGRLRTQVGRDVRDALADFRVTGARLLKVLVPRRVGVDDLVSQRLLPGDPAAHAGPGRDVVDAYGRLVDDPL